MKLRGLLEVRAEVLRRAGRYRVARDNLHVKEVWVDDRRYVVCFNPDEATKDRHDRAQLIAAIETKFAKGGIKQLIPNRGDRRYLRVRAGRFEVDAQRVREEARYDGKYVLRTTTVLPAEEVALAYKNLLWIERLFRDLKSLLETPPIYHHWIKDNVKGHIFGGFLALYLVVVLRKKIERLGPARGVGRPHPRSLPGPGDRPPARRPAVPAAHRSHRRGPPRVQGRTLN